MHDCKVSNADPEAKRVKRKILIIVAMLVPLALFAVAVMSLDEPDFTLVEQFDDFEFREYPPFVVAETQVDGGFEEAGSPAFRVLIDYIQGGNQGGRNLPMTAPVNQQLVTQQQVNQQPVEGGAAADGERIGQDVIGRVPMTQSGSETTDSWLFQFVMPKEYKLPMLPAPIDGRVTLRRMPARLVAARRYSGGWGEQAYRDNEQVLFEALRSERLTPVGAPVFARYNAPFVPGFLRRNEVLVEVESP
jgi:hypothetical protein